MDINEKLLVEADYFKDFRCAASGCRNNCCHGWTIYIESANYHKLRAMRKSSELEKLFATGVKKNKKALNDAMYAEMALKKNGECVFLDEEHLCRLQKECGYGALSNVCKLFPRETHVIANLVTKSCSLSCEGIVDRMWENTDGMNIYCDPMTRKEFGELVSFPQGTEWLAPHLLQVQTICIDFLQNRAYSLEKRIAMVGVALKELEEQGEPGYEAWEMKYEALSHAAEPVESLRTTVAHSDWSVFNTIFALKTAFGTVTPQFAEQRSNVLRQFKIAEEGQEVSYDADAYQKSKLLLNAVFEENPHWMENMMVNQFFNNHCPIHVRGMWMSYVIYCIQFSILKFLLAGIMTENTTKEDLTDMVVLWSRATNNNRARMESLANEMHINNSDTLAHMVILIND